MEVRGSLFYFIFDVLTEEAIAGSVSYRNMCRFNSGFFFKHPLMEQYQWYWRVEYVLKRSRSR